MRITSLALLYLGVACLFEWRQRRVPNWLVLPALALVAGWRLGSGDWSVFLASCVIYFAAWRSGLIGGGDAKVIIALVGVWPTPAYLAWLGGGLVAVYGAMLFLEEGLLRMQRGSQESVSLPGTLNHPQAREKPLLVVVLAISLLYLGTMLLPE